MIIALNEPAVAGVKLALIVQLSPPERCDGQLLDCLKLLASIPDRPILDIVNELVPELESVTV